MTKLPSWGVTGWSNTWTALDEGREDDSGLVAGYGIERVVDPGVVYVDQPRVDGIPQWFEKPGSRGRKFQMGWAEDSAPHTQSLLDLHASIAPRRSAIVEGDPQLKAIDECIDLLVSTATRLHGSHQSLGFLQPDSARFGTRHDGSRYLVLPDVGFAWDNAGGLMEPEWLSNPRLELVFDKGARAHNAAYLARLRRPTDERDIRVRAKTSAAEDADDVKLLARLIVVALVGADEARRWCGGSKALLSIPGRDIAPDTQAPIWDQVLAPALAGQIPTCNELAMRLAVHRPSAHFLFKPPAPPWRGWAAIRKAALVAVAIAALAGLWQLKSILFPPRVPAPYCKQARATDPLYSKLESLRDLHDAARVDAAKRPEYWLLLKECRKEHSGMKSCSDDCLRELVEEHLRVVEEEAVAVLQSLDAQPRPVAEERTRIEAAMSAIVDSLTEISRSSKPAIMARLERQMRLRGGPAAASPTNTKE